MIAQRDALGHPGTRVAPPGPEGEHLGQMKHQVAPDKAVFIGAAIGPMLGFRGHEQQRRGQRPGGQHISTGLQGKGLAAQADLDMADPVMAAAQGANFGAVQQGGATGRQSRFHPGRSAIHLAVTRAFPPEAIGAAGQVAQGQVAAIGVQARAAQPFQQGGIAGRDRRRWLQRAGGVWRHRIGRAGYLEHSLGFGEIGAEKRVADRPATGRVRALRAVIQIMRFGTFQCGGVEYG